MYWSIFYCAEVELLQVYLSLEWYVSKYVNTFDLYLVWNKCILNILLFY